MMPNTNKIDIVFNTNLDKTLHRVILLKVLLSGSIDGDGERIISHEAMMAFCCCPEKVLLKEINILARRGFLVVRKITEVFGDSKHHHRIIEKSSYGYTIRNNFGF